MTTPAMIASADTTSSTSISVKPRRSRLVSRGAGIVRRVVAGK
jgi:hypothetical protein